jgi:hypothetical protein
MNERIKELEVQCWEERKYGPPWFNSEKFAELIVRECMKESMAEIVSDENIEQESDPLLREYLHGNNQGIVDAVIRFRNHFGVEE